MSDLGCRITIIDYEFSHESWEEFTQMMKVKYPKATVYVAVTD